jgi:hypothetical protein
MRRVIAIACTSCGRLAFDEVAVVAPDAAGDAAGVTCKTFEFDQQPAGFVINDTGGSVEIIGGQIRFAIPGTRNNDIDLERADPRSFVGRSVAIQVVSPSLTPGASTAFGWHEQTGDRIGVHMEMDGVNLKLNQYSVALDQYVEYLAKPYDPIEFAWWRLRDDGGDIRSEVSRDGVTWNKFGVVSGRDLTSMTWDIGMGSYVSNVAPSETTMDNAIDCDP